MPDHHHLIGMTLSGLPKTCQLPNNVEKCKMQGLRNCGISTQSCIVVNEGTNVQLVQARKSQMYTTAQQTFIFHNPAVANRLRAGISVIAPKQFQEVDACRSKLPSTKTIQELFPLYSSTPELSGPRTIRLYKMLAEPLAASMKETSEFRNNSSTPYRYPQRNVFVPSPYVHTRN